MVSEHVILDKLRQRTEAASREFCDGGRINYQLYAKRLSDAILEALDEGMQYPTLHVCKWIVIERSKSDAPSDQQCAN